jgi:hypothetical protein
MSQNLAEIVHPLVEKGLFENAEIAVRNLMLDYTLHHIEHYQEIIRKFEQKYGMNYDQFNKYLSEHAKKVGSDIQLQKRIMTEEEDALDWKIATEMLESWLGLRRKSEA